MSRPISKEHLSPNGAGYGSHEPFQGVAGSAEGMRSMGRKGDHVATTEVCGCATVNRSPPFPIVRVADEHSDAFQFFGKRFHASHYQGLDLVALTTIGRESVEPHNRFHAQVLQIAAASREALCSLYDWSYT
jgi:hypothetical protein